MKKSIFHAKNENMKMNDDLFINNEFCLRDFRQNLKKFVVIFVGFFKDFKSFEIRLDLSPLDPLYCPLATIEAMKS